jgi:hypothetical protein
MKFWPLLWGSLRRRKARTVFTLLSILVAFVLFSYLAAVRVAFSMGIDVAGADRLLTTHKTSIIQPLPVSYKDQIARVPGVTAVTHATWFGGIYQDPSKGFQGVFQGPIEPEAMLAMYPEFKVPDDQKRAWIEDKEGVLVGITTAKRYGWKVGDRVPIQGTFWRKKDGSKVWEFNVRGIYTGAKGVDTTQFLFHYDYFDEARQFGQGIVGWYIVRIADPAQTAAVSKKMVADENSPAGPRRHGKGVGAGVRGSGRQYRRDHPVDPRGGLLHSPARHREHDRPVGARADERACGVEDGRLLGWAHARAGPRRVVPPRDPGRRARAQLRRDGDRRRRSHRWIPPHLLLPHAAHGAG